MPLIEPTADSEKTMLTALLDASLRNARSTVHGLDTEQMTARPVGTSELTMAWLIGHLGDVVDEWTSRIAAAPAAPEATKPLLEMIEEDNARTAARSAASADELRAEFDQKVSAALARLDGIDLDAELPVPEGPYFPPNTTGLTVRWAWHHLLGEILRHSGHADILREAIDGTDMYSAIAADQDIDLSYLGAWFAEHPEEAAAMGADQW